MRVIPAIDLKGGKCVRLFKGDFERTTEYSDDPVAMGHAFAEFSTTDLHVVDLDGARSGAQANHSLISQMTRDLDLDIQLGGGIRDSETLRHWLDAGVRRCVIGSLAVTEPDLVKSWLVQVGADRIVLALDVAIDDGVPLVTTHGWTRPSDTSVFECIEDYRDLGLRHVLCTDVSRDGAMAGPNIGLYRDILARFPHIELQASGGIRHLQDLEDLRAAGLPAAITGRALLDGKITAAEIASFRHDA